MSWPEDRPEHDPDAAYDETAEEWTDDTDILKAAGGKNKEVLIVIGNFKIYYGDLD